MTELGFIRGVAKRRGDALRAPLSGRTCLEYRVVVTRTRLGAARDESCWQTVIHVDSGFTPWILEDVVCEYDHFDVLLGEALAAHGNRSGGFDVLAPLSERATTRSARDWRLCSGDPPPHERAARAAGALALIHLLPPVMLLLLLVEPGLYRDGVRRALQELFAALTNREERMLRELGLGPDLDASRARRSAREIFGYEYAISEMVIRPGDTVQVTGATATTEANIVGGYRTAGVRRGLHAPR